MVKTVSLELAKQLKKAGFPQDSQNVYVAFKDEKPYPISLGIQGDEYIAVTQRDEDENDIGLNVLPKSEYKIIIAAPTAEEILERLPHVLNDGSFLHIRKDERGKYAILYTILADTYHGFSWYENLAEAAGLMYLYLKQNNLL